MTKLIYNFPHTNLYRNILSDRHIQGYYRYLTMKGIFIVSVLLCCVFTTSSVAVTTPSFSTPWPEICRVMALYRDCSDQSFRVACGQQANCSSDCVGDGMTYFKSVGSCVGGTTDGVHQWAYAQDACSWYNGKLYMLKDESDAGILEYSLVTSGSSHNTILVGALNVGKSNVWVNVDGTLQDDSFWSGTSTAPTDSNEQCMYSKASDSYKKAYDNCNNNYPFICYSDPA